MPKLMSSKLFQHVLQASTGLLLVHLGPTDFKATTLKQTSNVGTFDLVVLHIVVLHQAEVTVGLSEHKVLGNVLKMGAFFELQDWRELMPCLIADDCLEILDVDVLMADIVDDVEKVLDRCTLRVQPKYLSIYPKEFVSASYANYTNFFRIIKHSQGKTLLHRQR